MDTTTTVDIEKTTENFLNLSESGVPDELKAEKPESEEQGSNELEKENPETQMATEEEISVRIQGVSSFGEIKNRVLNDKGRLIDDEILENEFTAFIKEYENKESYELDKSAVFYSKLGSLHKAYNEKISIGERINSGTATKCKIQVAMLLNMEKKLRRIEGKEWVNYYERTYGKKGLRSAQIYMALAKVPNILQHAAIGKERLTQALRAIKILKITGNDQIKELLQQCGVQVNPNSDFDVTMTDIKLGVDYAVAVARIKKSEEKKGFVLGVNLDLIKRMLREGHSVSSQFIADLYRIKGESRNVNAHIERICKGNRDGDEMLPHIKKVESFHSIVKDLKSTIESLRIHQTLAVRIKRDDANLFENYAAELKGIVENTGSTTE